MPLRSDRDATWTGDHSAVTGHLANPLTIVWVLLSVFAWPHWLPNRDEDETIQSEQASHFSGRSYPGSKPQERLLWNSLRVVRCTRLHKLGPRLVCPSSFGPSVKKSLDYFFYLNWYEIFLAVIFQTCKHSEFPRERLLVSRQVSLVVGLLCFRLQTGWSYLGISSRVYETVIPLWLGPQNLLRKNRLHVGQMRMTLG